MKGGHTHGARTASTRELHTPNWAEPVEPSLFYKNVLKPAPVAAGLPVSTPARADTPAEKGVRLHDLRHTFTVATLLAWYGDGGDVTARLPLLSTYLGHVDPKSTYWYLQATPELLAAAAERLETAAWPGARR